VVVVGWSQMVVAPDAVVRSIVPALQPLFEFWNGLDPNLDPATVT